MPELQCPRDRRHPLHLDDQIKNLDRSFNGTVSCRDGHEFRIANNIIDLLPDSSWPGGSLANYSNHFSLTASVYEDQWRKRSIGLLSGQDFSLEDEAELLRKWTGDPVEANVIVDIGTSTGFYSRSIAQTATYSDIYAIDISQPMLQEAVRRGKQENAAFFPVRCDAARLPFFDDQVDLLLCGGTYNELYEPENTLKEMQRVLKPGGLCFMMYLTKATTYPGRLLQYGMAPGGVDFPKQKKIAQTFKDAGFESVKYRQIGVVNFELLKSV